MPDRPDITHVIPAHNEEMFLPRTLESVRRAMDAFEGTVEVIVVDNDSTDRTAEIAREFGATVVVETHRVIAAVRNAGGAAAHGRILTFADADSMVSENFFAEAARLLDGGGCVGGNFGVRTDRTSLGIRLSVWILETFLTTFMRVGGGSYFCLRSTFEEVGGFDTTMDCAEDVAFARALRRYGKRRGLRYAMEPTAYVTTSMRKADHYGDWFAIRFLLLTPFMALRPSVMRRELREHFYEFDKSKPSIGFRRD